MPNHITWRGNWRKMSGRIDGKKRFEIQGDGAKYDVHFIPGRGKRSIVSAKQATMKSAQMAAERYAAKHLGASASTSASSSSSGGGSSTKTYKKPKGHKPGSTCPFCKRAGSAKASASASGGGASSGGGIPKGHKPGCQCFACKRARAGGASSASAGSRRPRSDAELNKRISIKLTQKQMERVKRAA